MDILPIHLSCPRPKNNRRARRDSGGLVIYCKSYLSDGISIVKRDEKGICWIKFDKLFFKFESDIYFSFCYIPTENSFLYASHLRDFDYNGDDIRHFSNTGDVYLYGDLNSRCGVLSDRVEQLGLG